MAPINQKKQAEVISIPNPKKTQTKDESTKIRELAESLKVKIKSEGSKNGLNKVEMERAIALLSSDRTIRYLSKGKSLKLEGYNPEKEIKKNWFIQMFANVFTKKTTKERTKSWNIKYENGKLDLIWSSKRGGEDEYKSSGNFNTVSKKDLWQATYDVQGKITSKYHKDGIIARRTRKESKNYKQDDNASNVKKFVTKGKKRERVYDQNKGVEKWAHNQDDSFKYDDAKIIGIYKKNLPRITAQIFALLDNDCLHMDMHLFHNIVGREVGGEMQLNVIDWQRSSDRNIIGGVDFKMVFFPERLSKMERYDELFPLFNKQREKMTGDQLRELHDLHIFVQQTKENMRAMMLKNRKLSTILCLCQTVLIVDPDNPTAKTMSDNIITALKTEVADDKLEELYNKCREQLEENCFETGNTITKKQIDQQAIDLNVKGMNHEINAEAKVVKVVTLNDLKPSMFSRIFSRFNSSKNDVTKSREPTEKARDNMNATPLHGERRPIRRISTDDFGDTAGSMNSARLSSSKEITGLINKADLIAKKNAEAAQNDAEAAHTPPSHGRDPSSGPGGPNGM